MFQRPAALPGVLYDSDMGANIDSALALAVLYGAAAKMKVVALTVTNPNLESAAYCDVVARFYTTGGKLNSTPAHYHFPVGYPGEGKSAKSFLTSPDFGATVKELNDTAEVAIVVRNALTAQKDGEAVIVVAGPVTNLIRSLALPGNSELIAAKTGMLVLAAGAFAGNAPDTRIKADIPGARRLFAEWPSPIVLAGREVGAAVPYPGSSIANDFSWAPVHPIAEAYKAFKPFPYDAPSQAVIAALYATDIKSDLFKLSEPGRIEVLDDGRTRFAPDAKGRHRHILVGADPEWKASVTKAFTTLASAKPATPQGRGFRPQQQQQQPKPESLPKP
jgi:hypothetical protein